MCSQSIPSNRRNSLAEARCESAAEVWALHVERERRCGRSSRSWTSIRADTRPLQMRARLPPQRSSWYKLSRAGWQLKYPGTPLVALTLSSSSAAQVTRGFSSSFISFYRAWDRPAHRSRVRIASGGYRKWGNHNHLSSCRRHHIPRHPGDLHQLCTRLAPLFFTEGPLRTFFIRVDVDLAPERAVRLH